MVSICLVIVSDFNSRPCERGFGIGGKYHDGIKNFNSRPCERGFTIELPVTLSSKISIHAPARGASIALVKLLEH